MKENIFRIMIISALLVNKAYCNESISDNINRVKSFNAKVDKFLAKKENFVTVAMTKYSRNKLKITQIVATTKNNEKSVSISYSLPSKKIDVVLLQLSYDTGNSDYLDYKLINETFTYFFTKKSTAHYDKVEIIGHTDLEQTREDKSYDSDNYCSNLRIAPNTNECLGTVRAYKVSKDLKKYLAKNDMDSFIKFVQSPIYHSDFFMRDTDKMLEETLLPAMGDGNEKNKIQDISTELGFSLDDNIDSIRNDNAIKEKIRLKLAYFRDKFKDFRSVVIIAHIKKV
jgi:hypothetical protein